MMGPGPVNTPFEPRFLRAAGADGLLRGLPWRFDRPLGCAPCVKASIVIGGRPVFRAGLPVVTGFAQRLPVFLIPEKLRIAAVGCDVIHHRCLHIPALPRALGAEGVGAKVGLGRLPPSAGVTAGGCGAALLRVKGGMRLAVLAPSRDKLWTTWVAAWVVWPARHAQHLLYLEGKHVPAGFRPADLPVGHAHHRLPMRKAGDGVPLLTSSFRSLILS